LAKRGTRRKESDPTRGVIARAQQNTHTNKKNSLWDQFNEAPKKSNDKPRHKTHRDQGRRTKRRSHHSLASC